NVGHFSKEENAEKLICCNQLFHFTIFSVLLQYFPRNSYNFIRKRLIPEHPLPCLLFFTELKSQKKPDCSGSFSYL
ncbi:hypothetical protein L0N00_17620, partial [Eggerthella lenta]|nr:hypothetical protein [Eggerthella lenta]